MRSISRCWLVLAGCLLCTPALAAPKDNLSSEQLTALHRLIKPQPGESPWARVPWLTNLDEARRRAAKEDKPLFVWRAGGGEVLGRA
jgi:hypothetical protein